MTRFRPKSIAKTAGFHRNCTKTMPEMDVGGILDLVAVSLISGENIFSNIVIYFWFGVVWAAIMGAGSIARIINMIFLLDLIKKIA